MLALLLGAGELPPAEQDAVRARVLRGLEAVPSEVRGRILRLLAGERPRPPSGP
ncbi:hypothetical protein [Streptomyces sp. NPDC049590]|uniref:hypothetical protein n=1 Tax=Streptomyces sp. NPDC049590 TaxID=3154834 RepID=UPI00343C7618